MHWIIRQYIYWPTFLQVIFCSCSHTWAALFRVTPFRHFLQISSSLKVHIRPSRNIQLLIIFMPSKKDLHFSVMEQCNYSMKLSFWRQLLQMLLLNFHWAWHILHYTTLHYTFHLITHASVVVNHFSEDNVGDMRLPRLWLWILLVFGLLYHAVY